MNTDLRVKYPVFFSDFNEGKRKAITGLDRASALQEFEVSRISKESAHEGGKFVSPRHRPP